MYVCMYWMVQKCSLLDMSADISACPCLTPVQTGNGAGNIGLDINDAIPVRPRIRSVNGQLTPVTDTNSTGSSINTLDGLDASTLFAPCSRHVRRCNKLFNPVVLPLTWLCQCKQTSSNPSHPVLCASSLLSGLIPATTCMTTGWIPWSQHIYVYNSFRACLFWNGSPTRGKFLPLMLPKLKETVPPYASPC